MLRIRKVIFDFLVALLSRRGYEVSSVEQASVPKDWLCLNIGSGGRSLPGFVDLDVPNSHYDGVRSANFISFDLRKDKLPFPDGIVNLIYCSHVLEHIEEQFVEHFIEESSRVLKYGGVCRITCPDAAFLYVVSSFENEYWSWRHDLLAPMGIRPNNLTQYDFLVRELASPVFRDQTERGMVPNQASIVWETDQIRIKEQLDEICSQLTWSSDSIGDHINWLSFEKISLLAEGKFRFCVQSKFKGSVSKVMRSAGFDLTYPQMSLYVDLVK